VIPNYYSCSAIHSSAADLASSNEAPMIGLVRKMFCARMSSYASVAFNYARTVSVSPQTISLTPEACSLGTTLSTNSTVVPPTFLSSICNVPVPPANRPPNFARPQSASCRRRPLNPGTGHPPRRRRWQRCSDWPGIADPGCLLDRRPVSMARRQC